VECDEERIAQYVAKCLVCQQVKAEHQRPARLLQPLPIPEWKWEYVTIDFVIALPRSPKGNNAVWVVIDRLTKSAHFIPFKVGAIYRASGRQVHEGDCSTSWSSG